MVIEWWLYLLVGFFVVSVFYLIVDVLKNFVGDCILNGYKKIEEHKEKNAKTKP